MLLTHAVLGGAAALGGDWAQKIMGRHWGLLLGPLLILLGLMWPGWLKIRLPWLALRGKRISGPWGAFLLGIPFSVAVCPFCTPALLVSLTASAATGSVTFGAGLLLAFAAGRSIPILIGAWAGWNPCRCSPGIKGASKSSPVLPSSLPACTWSTNTCSSSDNKSWRAHS